MSGLVRPLHLCSRSLLRTTARDEFSLAPWRLSVMSLSIVSVFFLFFTALTMFPSFPRPSSSTSACRYTTPSLSQSIPNCCLVLARQDVNIWNRKLDFRSIVSFDFRSRTRTRSEYGAETEEFVPCRSSTFASAFLFQVVSPKGSTAQPYHQSLGIPESCIPSL